MYRDASVAVVVPAYNEAGFVCDVIDTMPAFVDAVFVVDDYSSDGTWEEVVARTTRVVEPEVDGSAADSVAALADGSGVRDPDRARETEPRADALPTPEVVAVRHRRNRGRGGAVKTGYRLARHAGFDVVAVMDGDGQMDPDILDEIVDPVVSGRADYAKGNRLVDRDHREEMSNWRLFGNVLLTLLTKVASGQWDVRDPQNGYTAISAEALDELPIEDLYEDYGFLNDILVRLDVHGLRVENVPMKARYGDESSGIEYRTFVPKLSLLLLRGFLWRLWVKYVTRSGFEEGSEHGVP